MTTFNIITLTCPNCKSKMQTYELMSYHVHSSIIYSDGKVESNPSTPNNKSILVCPVCNKAFWNEDAVHEEFDYEKDEKLPNAMDVYDLPFAFEDDFSAKLVDYYFDLLNNGFASSNNNEIFLRIEIWHLLNNKIRYKPKTIFSNIKKYGFKQAVKTIENSRKAKLDFNSKIKQFDGNLKQLISIFIPEFDEEKLMLAEMHRELGQFKMAYTLLKEIDKSKNPLAHRQILNAVKKEKKEVFIIKQK